MTKKKPTLGENQIKSRHLDWPECYNARDLGGLPLGDGRVTRWKSIVRSDLLGRLTAEGKQALIDYGVRTIIDLRRLEEVEQDPPARFEDRDHLIAYFNIPIERNNPEAIQLIKQAYWIGEIYCIILDYYFAAIAEILRAIANAQPGGVAFHCYAGKDRTGMISALLLGLVGVPAETIAEDYEASQTRLLVLDQKTGEDAVYKDDEEFQRRWLATKEAMLYMLGHLDQKYGGVEPYLRQAGLTEVEIDRLKRRLVD
jgi:protein-tyrosine phosphatase